MIEGSIIPPGQGPSGQLLNIVVPAGDPGSPSMSDTGESVIPNPGTGTDVTVATDQNIQDNQNPEQ
jgi:hypothetical protein